MRLFGSLDNDGSYLYSFKKSYYEKGYVERLALSSQEDSHCSGTGRLDEDKCKYMVKANAEIIFDFWILSTIIVLIVLVIAMMCSVKFGIRITKAWITVAVLIMTLVKNLNNLCS